MRPESNSVTNRPDLSVLSREYDDQKAQGQFISMKAAPIIRVPTAEGGYPIFNRANFKKGPTVKPRAAGARYPRITGTFGKGTFSCDDYGIEYPLDDRIKRRYANLFDAERAGTRILRHQTLLARELRVSLLYANAGLTNHNVDTAWSTIATAIPLDDIELGINALQDSCGVGKGFISLIMPRDDFREIQRTDQVKDKSKHTLQGIQPGLMSAAQLAALLDIKEVLVPGGGYDNTEEGVAESNTQIWTAGVMYLVVLADEDDTMEEPSFARTALWALNSPDLPVMESYREPQTNTDVVRERMDVDEFLQGETDLFAYKLTNT
jgi:hypothetical protein